LTWWKRVASNTNIFFVGLGCSSSISLDATQTFWTCDLTCISIWGYLSYVPANSHILHHGNACTHATLY
jgi:hypothetical protein